MNRDLGLAGKVLYTDSQGNLKESIVCLDRHPLTIPQLAIHLDREVNEKGLILDKQKHLNALAALENSFQTHSSFLECILQEVIKFEKIIAHDLFLFPLEKAQLIGYNNAFLSGYRIDSLVSVYAALTAIIQHSDPLEEDIKMAIFWDNEEIGSNTPQGAASPFFNQVLEVL